LNSRQVQLLICKPAGYREDFPDPSLPGWVFDSPLKKECDGDVLNVSIQDAIADFFYDWWKDFNIDCTKYKKLILRYRIVSYSGPDYTCFAVVGSLPGGDKWIEVSPFQNIGEWKIKEVDVENWGASNSYVNFYFYNELGGGYDIEVEIDFLIFTEETPFYDDDDLGDVFDIPRYAGGVNGQADFLQLIIDNHDGQHKTRFTYRDEAYLWVKKNGDFHRLFGGYIDAIDPESVQYGADYLTLNMLGWSALLYQRFIAETYSEEDADDIAKDILDLAEKQAALGFTTFGIKDVQKEIDVLKCDYDEALKKLVEMVEQLDLCFHVEPNRDASLYPLGKRFLRYAGWMEDFWEKGWGCTAYAFETDGDVAQIKTKAEGGSGTLYRVTLISVDSTIFKKLLLELKGSDVDTEYSVKVVTEDDAEYTVQALTAAPTSYTVKEWDLTSIITGANKVVKNVKLGISKAGGEGILYFKWLGFFPVTPPYEKVTLDAATNVHAGAFQRDPKKARNMIIVKGDKFTYNVPPDSDEWTKNPAPDIIEEDNVAFWTPSKWGSGGIGEPVISADTTIKKAGVQSTKVVVGSGTYAWWACFHGYDPQADWSGYRYIFLWWYGTNSGKWFEVNLPCQGWMVWINYCWKDDYSGWPSKPIIIDLYNPDYIWPEGYDVGEALKNIDGINIMPSSYYAEGNVSGTFHFDEVVISVQRFCWGAEFCTLSNDQDAKAGTASLKAVLEQGVLSDFYRLSSGFILYDPFNTLDLTKYDKGAHGDGDGDSYVSGGELVNKIRAVSGSSYRRYIVTKDKKQLNSFVVESKLISEGLYGPTSNRLILSTQKTTTGNPTDTDHVQVNSFNDWDNTKTWAVEERDYPNDPVIHYNSGPVSDHTKVAKVIITGNTIKVYLDDQLVCNATRVLSFTQAYIYLYGSTANTEYQYPKQDNLKIYKSLKIYVEGLAPQWKVELWSGTNASPGEKVAEATVPGGSTIAELDVLTLVFPFTGFFKVYDASNQLDHTSPDYNDIWGGDHYKAKQTTNAEHLIYFPRTKDLNMNALELKKLKFWMKQSLAEQSCKLILATDDSNYYYMEFWPTTKWRELFQFNVGFLQNIEFEEVGSPQLKEINYIGILYPSDSPVGEWCKIDEMRFEGESESWGIAKDEAKIAEYGLQPEKVTSSYFKTPEDAQAAADYFLTILKEPPLIKGSVTHPWGLPQIRAGDTAIVNVPNENINNEEMVIQEPIHMIPPASTKFTTEINLAGLPHALTDPQKRLKEYIERLQKADVYADKVELFTSPLREFLEVVDAAEFWSYILDDFNDNNFDTDKWAETQLGSGGSIVEQNQRLEVTVNSGWASKGVRTNQLFKTRGVLDFYSKVYMEVPLGGAPNGWAWAAMYMSPHETSEDPWFTPDWLLFYLVRAWDAPPNDVYIAKSVDGVVEDLYWGTWETQNWGQMELMYNPASKVVKAWRKIDGGWTLLYQGQTDLDWNDNYVYLNGAQDSDNLITFIGAGAGASANNASVSPALPSGFQANDLLLCFASARGNGTLGTPTGWTQLFQVAHSSSGINKIALFYKIAVGGDANPTVTYTGGASGHTVIAQCCAFRGVDPSSPFDVIGATSSNASQANIGPISGITPTVEDACVIVMGHKADDWTSVATLSGDGLTWVEIGEPDSDLGNDAGEVWDYAIISGSPITITNKTFTVTGGAAQTGLGKMISLKPAPQITYIFDDFKVDCVDIS